MKISPNIGEKTWCLSNLHYNWVFKNTPFLISTLKIIIFFHTIWDTDILEKSNLKFYRLFFLTWLRSYINILKSIPYFESSCKYLPLDSLCSPLRGSKLSARCHCLYCTRQQCILGDHSLIRLLVFTILFHI